MLKFIPSFSCRKALPAAGFFGLALCLVPALPPCAYADTVDIKYSVSLSVLPIGVAYLNGKINTDTYKV